MLAGSVLPRRPSGGCLNTTGLPGPYLAALGQPAAGEISSRACLLVRYYRRRSPGMQQFADGATRVAAADMAAISCWRASHHSILASSRSVTYTRCIVILRD